jgi:hypothetical protein
MADETPNDQPNRYTVGAARRRDLGRGSPSGPLTCANDSKTDRPRSSKPYAGNDESRDPKPTDAKVPRIETQIRSHSPKSTFVVALI